MGQTVALASTFQPTKLTGSPSSPSLTKSWKRFERSISMSDEKVILEVSTKTHGSSAMSDFSVMGLWRKNERSTLLLPLLQFANRGTLFAQSNPTM